MDSIDEWGRILICFWGRRDVYYFKLIYHFWSTIFNAVLVRQVLKHNIAVHVYMCFEVTVLVIKWKFPQIEKTSVLNSISLANFDVVINSTPWQRGNIKGNWMFNSWQVNLIWWLDTLQIDKGNFKDRLVPFEPGLQIFTTYFQTTYGY